MNKEFVYTGNIGRIKAFYYGDEFIRLSSGNDKKLIKKAIKCRYKDPDSCDSLLYAELSKKYGLEKKGYNLYDKNGIKLSADCVNGWGKLYDLRQGTVEWLVDYENVRSLISSHLLWPQHRIPTINTLRQAVFKDRVDYTLFDISNFYVCLSSGLPKEQTKREVENICKLHKGYLNNEGNTFEWLADFGTFENFINQMKLQRFVDSNYKVINIERMDSVITEYAPVYQFTEEYWNNLIALLRE